MAFESGVEIPQSRSTWLEACRIAGAAVDELHGAETVYLDEGFTPRLIAELLADQGPATVVTASLLAAEARWRTAAPSPSCCWAGGCAAEPLATVDEWALERLRSLVIDVAFLGTNGIDAGARPHHPDPAVAAVKQTAVRVAAAGCCVAAHSKFGQTSFCRFAEVSDFQTIVTGTELPVAQAHRYEALGPNIIRS